MRIVRRDPLFGPDPIRTISIWAIPLFFYLVQKFVVKNIIPGREFIWWVTIPSLFIVWLFVNFKIIKNGKDL